jgi:parvulin-like peptidyl-prolyl cis-trans isomerase-like protein/PPIC-type peptidyl-prolyl cis-trans isomerase-like protein
MKFKTIPALLTGGLMLLSTLTAGAETLITINGEDITAADMDAMIMDMHRGGDMSAASNVDLTRLLEKSVNDLLLVQQALSMGMDSDPLLQPILMEKQFGYAVKELVDATFTPPAAVSEDSVRADFEYYYWRMVLRQLSVPTIEEAMEYRSLILAGASMDSLAQAHSLDVHKAKGGLHGAKYWGDIENVLRERLQGMQAGQITQPFPYRDVYTIVKVEEVQPLDESAWESKSPRLRRHRQVLARDEAWAAYVDSLLTVRPVRIDEKVLDGIKADGEYVFEGRFQKSDNKPVLLSGGMHVTTAGALRKAIAHTAMENGTTPFPQLLEMTLDAEIERLVLRETAEADGFAATETVQALWYKDRDEALIQAYLSDTIVNQIKFRHDEFQEFYEEHKGEFSGPAEVRLDIMFVSDEAQANEMSDLLEQGADFDYVRKTYLSEDMGQTDWAPLSIFSQPIRDEVERLEHGEASRVIKMPTGWMIFRVLDFKDGRVPPIEELDMQIRQVMFQRKFNALLDEHLELLKERSDIKRYEDRIERYFAAGAE